MIEAIPHNLQLEVINLQCGDMLKSKYQEKNLIEFFKCLPNDEYAQVKSNAWDFPGGPVVKNPPANAGDTGSIPGLGRSHMLRSS